MKTILGFTKSCLSVRGRVRGALRYLCTSKYMDGNEATAEVAYKMSENLFLYPISPSSEMGNSAELWATEEKENLFGRIPKMIQMQSEAGVIGAIQGSLVTGGLSSTFTSSQGLLLMIPTLYQISTQLHPFVFHVASRSVATNSTNIGCDHGDINAIRSTGVSLLSSRTPQEAYDKAIISHIATLKSRIPICHFFDGGYTSHQINLVETVDDEDILELMMKNEIHVEEHRNRALNPTHPSRIGSSIGKIHYQLQEAVNPYFRENPIIIKETMDEFAKKTGREYQLFHYSGSKTAESIIVAMGSSTKDIESTVEYLNNEGYKVGCLSVGLYRPWSVNDFIDQIPDECRKIAVLDRTTDRNAIGEPLFMDVCTSLMERGKNGIEVFSGRYGLGGMFITPGDIMGIFDNFKATDPKRKFIIGIDDSGVSDMELPPTKELILGDCTGAIFYGMGGDGTVGSVRRVINLIGKKTKYFAQGDNRHTPHKSKGITESDLRYGTQLLEYQRPLSDDSSDFVICNNIMYVEKLDLTKKLKQGGTLVFNVPFEERKELESIEALFPNELKKNIAKKDATVFVVNAEKIAEESNIPGKINMIMMSVFLQLIKLFGDSNEENWNNVFDYLEKIIRKNFSGSIKNNIASLSKSRNAHVKIEYDRDYWEELRGKKEYSVRYPECDAEILDFVKKVQIPYNRGQEHKIKVKDLKDNGFSPTGTSKFEKRGIATKIPVWDPENCIQCNACSFNCPHSVIRSFVFDFNEEEFQKYEVSDKFKKVEFMGNVEAENPTFSIQVSAKDCVSCYLCMEVCPGKNHNKAIDYVEYNVEDAEDYQNDFDFSLYNNINDKVQIERESVRNSQFKQPLFEFSGACAGCAESTNLKIISQLFGRRMIVASATGCNTVYSSYYPFSPWTTNKDGCGPAYGRSLFENAAEFGFGMSVNIGNRREGLFLDVENLMSKKISKELKKELGFWAENYKNGPKTYDSYIKLKDLLENEKSNDKPTRELIDKVKKSQDLFIKPSMWVIGGDGWAYDIGFGGIDHVLSSNTDINILVMDNELYANTGGQSSKSTGLGTYLNLSSHGKRMRKKDLGLMMMTYKNIYVATIATTFKPNHTIKVLKEAESFPGPSLIIAYCGCDGHKIKGKKMKKQGSLKYRKRQEKLAVQSGYWPLFKYDPRKENPFNLVTKKIDSNSLHDFLVSESRFTNIMESKKGNTDEKTKELVKKSQTIQKELHKELEKHILERFDILKRMKDHQNMEIEVENME